MQSQQTIDAPRPLKRIEIQLLESMLRGTDYEHLVAQLPNAQVVDLEDSQPGSLRFPESSLHARLLEKVAERQFTDADGVPVSVALSVDQAGQLYELDVFKNDFSGIRSLRAGVRKNSGPVATWFANTLGS